MSVELWERPEAEEIHMVVGWRQWADAGGMSSGLPKYIADQTGARQIGKIRPNGFYLFQIPGTHDLVRPVVRFNDGYPDALETQNNDIYYTGDAERGLVIFLGDEPHLNVEGYVEAILQAARELKVKRIVSLGGVYGTLPYDKERLVSAIYSLPQLKAEVVNYAVNLSDYHGGASIGSYLCRRAGDNNVEMVGFYAFVPTYDFSTVSDVAKAIRIEHDHAAWLVVMRRINRMLKLNFDLTDLEQKSARLLRAIETKIDELDALAPELGVRDYMAQIGDQFTELSFDPLDDVWEDEIRRLFGEDEDA
ncbi:MAG: hypothetical protein OHK0046_14520 [Anaerolineae bacterium]